MQEKKEEIHDNITSDQENKEDKPNNNQPDNEGEEIAPKRKKNSPVTIEDVKAVLFDESGNPISPFRVGLKWLHEKIGHGSFTTIQKRITHIRDETNTIIEAPKIDTPPVPTDVAATLWKTAWEASRSHFLEKCNDMSSLNNQLRERCDVLANDIDPVLEEIAELERELEKNQEKIERMKEEMQISDETHSNELAEVNGQLQESRTQIKILTELIEKNIKPQA